jgi:hypothetical protein
LRFFFSIEMTETANVSSLASLSFSLPPSLSLSLPPFLSLSLSFSLYALSVSLYPLHLLFLFVRNNSYIPSPLSTCSSSNPDTVLIINMLTPSVFYFDFQPDFLSAVEKAKAIANKLTAQAKTAGRFWNITVHVL